MKKIISLLLVILLLGTVLIGCRKDGGDNTDPEQTNEVATDSTEIDDFPNIEKEDNGGRDFNILYIVRQLYQKYYFATEANGELINDVNFERQTLINDHLGVNIVTIPVDSLDEMSEKLNMAASSGDDPYQLALTHSYIGVTTNATNGNFFDFGKVQCLNLDADYWRKDSMEAMAIGGKMYLGSGRCMLYEPTVTLFNKDMVNSADESFNADDLYQLVRDKKWTIDNLKYYAQAVSPDQNEHVEVGKGVYGYVCHNDWEVWSFMAASNHFVVTRDQQSGKLITTPFSQKLSDIFAEVKDLFDQKYTYWYAYGATTDAATTVMREGRTMFATVGIAGAISTISNSEYKIGILPTPAYAEGLDVKSLDCCGYVVIPVSVVDIELSGAVVELLCYYGSKLVYPAFYDKLLGTRTAENWADAEMLDIIFASMVSDPGLAFIESSTDMQQMFYIFPHLIGKGSADVSSYMKSFESQATKRLQKMDK